MLMTVFWILGGGRFGLRAARLLRRRHPDASITIVEKQPEICGQLKKFAFDVICMEGNKFLAANLVRRDFPDWIIPAIPVHVAYEWVINKLSEHYRAEPLPIPRQLVSKLPNPIRGDAGQIYTSNADFICPDDCPEPEDICVYTGEPRKRKLHSFLQQIRHEPFQPVIVRSQQLLPGVGGYPPRDLFKLLEVIAASKTFFLLGTACRCHGVINAFRIVGKG